MVFFSIVNLICGRGIRWLVDFKSGCLGDSKVGYWLAEVERNAVTWTTMITGCLKSGKGFLFEDDQFGSEARWHCFQALH